MIVREAIEQLEGKLTYMVINMDDLTLNELRTLLRECDDLVVGLMAE